MRITSVLAAVLAVLIFSTWAMAWSLTDLMNGHPVQQTFDPENDIVFLPECGKDFFADVEDLSVLRRKEVRRFLYLYLTRGRDFTIRGIERSSMYKDVIDQIFAENPDIPEDLAFLPLLESGFNPSAVSRSRAVGLWQFMKNTSEPLGLKKNKWVDDRRSIEKSTRAAVRHLRGLYRPFGSWELALAAYNGGGGHVRRSMEKADTSDFWKLQETGILRNETSEYVPRFAALLIICRNLDMFRICDDINYSAAAETDTIRLKYSVPLSAVSRYSGSSVMTIRRLNPELSMNVTPPEGHDFKLRLPVRNIKKLAGNLDSLYRHKVKNVRTKTYRVKRGDTLSSIAKKTKTSTSAIMKFNRIKNADKIIPGRVLNIPAGR